MNTTTPVSFALLVLALPAQDRVAPIQERIAAALGAVDPVRIEATVRALAAFDTRHVLSATDDPERGTGAARRWLQQQYEALVESSGGRLRVELQAADVPCARQGMPRTVQVVNVIATLPGTTDPDRVYVVAGHYDSRNGRGEDGRRAAPGANDDASGTAVALEACRVLCGQRFAATLVFCAYDGEEQGLLGSQAHAAKLVEAGAQVDGMITCDIVGNTLGMDGVRHDGHVRCFSYAPTGNDSSGRSLARALTWASRTHVPQFPVKLVFRGDRYGRGGDHRSFFAEGFPAVRLTEPREDFSRQHQDVTERDGRPYGDLPDYVDYAYAANVARIVVATLAELAAAPPPPRVLRAQGVRDRYDTLVDFELPDGAIDCEFVWRDTTAADWEGAISSLAAGVERSGTRRRATLVGICLDDVVVGVRTVGADGSRSRVATPPEPDRFDMRRPQGGGR